MLGFPAAGRGDRNSMARIRDFRTDGPAPAGERQRPHSSWYTVDAGDRVLVAFPDGTSVRGKVDDLTGDLAVVWVAEDGHRRLMLHPSDGLTVAPA
jgi:hypothetical protein